jgi:hypothetical protein
MGHITINGGLSAKVTNPKADSFTSKSFKLNQEHRKKSFKGFLNMAFPFFQ